LKPDLAAPGVRIASAQAAGAYLPTTYPARHVTGDGASAYFQLSGTSQSAAVVSGAAALLLDQRKEIRGTDLKVALQLSSSFMWEAGLVSVGAGSVNVLAAVELSEQDRLATTGMSRELIGSLGLALSAPAAPWTQDIRSAIVSAVRGETIVWGCTIVWGSTIVWGASETQASTIVWGASEARANTIVWGSTIVWGVTGSTIAPGAVGDSTVVWGIDANRDFSASTGDFLE